MHLVCIFTAVQQIRVELGLGGPAYTPENRRAGFARTVSSGALQESTIVEKFASSIRYQSCNCPYEFRDNDDYFLLTSWMFYVIIGVLLPGCLSCS